MSIEIKISISMYILILYIERDIMLEFIKMLSDQTCLQVYTNEKISSLTIQRITFSMLFTCTWWLC